MPQATRSNKHHTYRCYLRGPGGVHGLSPCGPGALVKLSEPHREVNVKDSMKSLGLMDKILPIKKELRQQEPLRAEPSLRGQ